MEIKVTWKMMIEKVNARITKGGHDIPYQKGSSFAVKGFNHRLAVARTLALDLASGCKPTTAQVVAYFGKGARFAE